VEATVDALDTVAVGVEAWVSLTGRDGDAAASVTVGADG